MYSTVKKKCRPSLQHTATWQSTKLHEHSVVSTKNIPTEHSLSSSAAEKIHTFLIKGNTAN